jgi:hypothetical protein
LDPVKGETVTDCTIVIPGSTDYNITSIWPVPDNDDGPNNDNAISEQFKVRVAGQGSDTLSQILTGNNSSTIYLDGADFNRNPNLGYGWVSNGLHPNEAFDAFHYEEVGIGEGGKKIGPVVQDAVNAGGDYIFWAYDGFDAEANGEPGPENYIWGSTSYNTGIVLEITTTTGPTTGTPPVAAPSDVIPNGTYKIVNNNTGLALDVEGGSNASGTYVDTYTYQAQPWQQWNLTTLGHNTYELIGVGSGDALDVHGQSVAAGAAIDIYPYLDQSNQQWLIISSPVSGTYTIEGVQSGNFLQAGAKGAGVTMELNDGSPDQFWSFEAP